MSANANTSAAEDVRRAFGALPLGERLSTLIKVEMDMVGDVADAIVAAASRVADDIVDACAGPDQATQAPSDTAGQAPTS